MNHILIMADSFFLGISMTSKIKVDMSLCSHETVIEAEDVGDGTVKLKFESTCKDINHYAKLLMSVSTDDFCRIKGSRILEIAEESGLTPTCLVPAGVFNACWLETGMISRNLVKEKKTICLHFVE